MGAFGALAGSIALGVVCGVGAMLLEAAVGPRGRQNAQMARGVHVPYPPRKEFCSGRCEEADDGRWVGSGQHRAE